jgi:hypothetical protein
MTHKVGIDIGNSSVKYHCDFGSGEIPTWRSRGKITQVIVDPNAPLSSIRYNGEDLLLGEDAVLGQNFMWKTDEEKCDDFYVPFILLALARMGITQADIVLGLPVSTAASKKKVEKVKEYYTGTKEAIVNDKAITFNIRANVMSEPLGTFMTLIYDENSRYMKTSPYLLGELALIDIGFLTCDYIVLNRGKLAQTHTSMSGMYQFFEKVKSDLENEYSKMRPNEEVRIYNQIVNHFGTAQLKIGGDFVRPDFWKRAEQYRAQLAKDLAEEIRIVLTKMRPDRVMLTGGGSLFMKDELMNHNRHLMIHNNPRFANVIGFYRAAKTIPDQEAAGGLNADNRDRTVALQSR